MNPGNGVEAFDSIIMKCIEKQKKDRYPDISELQMDLMTSLKAEYKKSLKKSQLSGDIKRSRLYCGNLVLAYTESCNVLETLKWARDIERYAKGNDKDDLKDIMNKLDWCMENNREISDELTKKIEVVVHHIQYK